MASVIFIYDSVFISFSNLSYNWAGKERSWMNSQGYA